MAGVLLSSDLRGLKPLVARLEAIDERIARRVLGQILTAAARPMVDAAGAAAPVRKGFLKKSFVQVLRKTRKGWRPYVVVGPQSDLMFVMTDSAAGEARVAWPAKYAHLVERGTAPHSLETAVDMKAIRRGRTVFSDLAARKMAAAGENIGVQTRKYRDTARQMARDYLVRRDAAAGKRTHPGAKANPFFGTAMEAAAGAVGGLVETGLRSALASV